MEAVGFAASVLTLLSAALTSTQTINHLIQNLRDHPSSLSDLESAIRELTITLNYFRRFQNTRTDRDLIKQSIDATFSSDLEHLLVNCNKDLSQTEQKVRKIQSASTKNVLQKGKRAVKLFLSEEDFETAWRKIQLYTQQFAILLTRAGINNAEVKHLAMTQITRDGHATISADLSRGISDLKSGIEDHNADIKRAIHPISAVIQDSNMRLDRLATDQRLGETRLSQQIIGVEKLSAAQKQAQETGFAGLQTSIHVVQDDLKAYLSKLQIDDDKLNTISSLLNSLQSKLDSMGHQSSSVEVNPTLYPSPGQAEDLQETDESLRQSLLRLLSLTDGTYDPKSTPSLRPVIHDLTTLLDKAFHNAAMRAHVCIDCQQDQEDVVAQCRKAIESSQTLQWMDCPVPLPMYTDTKNLNGMTVNLNPSDIYKKVPLKEKDLSSQVKQADSQSELLNRKRRLAFHRPGEPISAGAAPSKQKMKVDLPLKTKMLTFEHKEGRVLVLHQTQKYRHPTSGNEEDEWEKVQIQVTLTPNKRGIQRRQTTLKFPRMVNWQGCFVPGPTIMIPKNMRSSNDYTFDIIRQGLTHDLLRCLETRAAQATDCDEFGRSLLAHALDARKPEICSLLLEHGADVHNFEPEFLDPDVGPGPLGYAWYENYCDVREHARQSIAKCIMTLLNFGMELTLRVGPEPKSCVENVLSCGPLELFKAMLDSGDPSLTPNEIAHIATSPLVELSSLYARGLSSSYEVPDKIALLLSRDASYLESDSLGWTCLHVLMTRASIPFGCAFQNQVCSHFDGELQDILMLMITAGANVYAVTHDGDSVSDFAFDHGFMTEWTGALEQCGFAVADVLSSRDVLKGVSWTSSVQPDSGTRDRNGPPFLTFDEYVKERASRRYFCNYHEAFEYRAKTACEGCNDLCREACCGPVPVQAGCCKRCQDRNCDARANRERVESLFHAEHCERHQDRNWNLRMFDEFLGLSDEARCEAHFSGDDWVAESDDEPINEEVDTQDDDPLHLD